MCLVRSRNCDNVVNQGAPSQLACLMLLSVYLVYNLVAFEVMSEAIIRVFKLKCACLYLYTDNRFNFSSCLG